MAKLKVAQVAESKAKETATATAEKLGTAQQALAVAQSQWQDVKTRQDRFLAQAKGRICSEYGQPIDDTHAERERAKFVKQFAETEAEGKRLKAETESLAAIVEQIRTVNTQRSSTEQSRLQHDRDEKQKRQEQDAIDKEVAAVAGEVNAVTTALALAEHELASAVATLPVSVRGDVEVQVLQDEEQLLDTAGVEKQFDALKKDRTLQAERERQLETIAGEIAQLPAVGRRLVTEVQQDITAAEAATQAARIAATAAGKSLEELNRRRGVRADLEAKMITAEHFHSLHDRLADLLGADGLQRAL
ncbi:hypothetical protein BH11PLA2_BH11PLA2_48130 [soil metagenome]